MRHRIPDRLKFLLERWIQRGAWQQLLLMAALIVGVALTGGLLAWALTDAFAHPGAAVWWSFLRLTDPGYLGDDEGTVLRVISTVVTVLGYVLFMGSLIAIMTQWLNQILRRLESGLTPISMDGHFLILSWTNRTPSIVRELALSEGRVRRFLKRRGAHGLRIVILDEEIGAERRQELRDQLGPALKRTQIFLRSGSSMRIEHLRRVDYASAAAIILPGADYEEGGPERMDARVIKTLLSIGRDEAGATGDAAPVVVAEVFDAHKIPIVQQAYPGMVHVLAGDAFISRLIVQTVRHRGLSFVYAELLSHTQGNEVYVRGWPELAGTAFGRLADAFPRAVLLGVVRPEGLGFRPFLNPPPGFTLAADDRLVVIARSYEDAAPAGATTGKPPPSASRSAPGVPTRARRRILVLGWSHKAPALVHEFGSYPNERFDLDIVSVVPAAERYEALERVEVPDGRVRVRHLEGDYTLQADLHRVAPDGYDNVVFLGSDWLDSGEETDARTLLGYVLLRSVLPPEAPGPDVLVELKDPANARLFRERAGEVIISPVILSHMLAHAALRQELTSVFGELFGPGGAEIFFRPALAYDLAGQTVDFREVRQRTAASGEIALGVRLQAQEDGPYGGIHLNPPPLTRFTLQPADEIVILTEYH